jgi:uncharacterized protein
MQIRRSMPASVLLLMTAFAAAALAQTTAPATGESEPSAGRAVYVGQELLRDYNPVSSLVTPVTHIGKPKFPVIDFHGHWTARESPGFLLKHMDDLGVSHAVNLSGGSGESALKLLDIYAAPQHAGRLITFVNLDFKDFDSPDWSAKQVAFLEEARARGAKGLKIFKGLGLTTRDGAGNLIPVDHAKLDPIWDRCGLIGFPVLIHSADPVPFFQPIDERNERWMQLKRHPDWSFFGPGFPSWDAVIAKRNRVIAQHPKTTFVVAHLAESGNDLKRLGEWLDAMPNMHVDLSGREAEIGRQPFAARRFFIKYADRVLFGTDRYPGRPDQPRYKVYYRILETEDEYFDYFDHGFPPTGEWKVYGLHLPDDVLQQVYSGNAKRLLRIDD